MIPVRIKYTETATLLNARVRYEVPFDSLHKIAQRDLQSSLPSVNSTGEREI